MTGILDSEYPKRSRFALERNKDSSKLELLLFFQIYLSAQAQGIEPCSSAEQNIPNFGLH